MIIENASFFMRINASYCKINNNVLISITYKNIQATRRQKNMPQWVTVTEASIKLGIGPSKISRLIKAGKITAIEDLVDKRVKLIDLEEVQKLFKRK
jgi:hypothetical protein